MFPWLQFLAYVLVTAGTPGPNTLMSMGNGSRLGFRRALPFNFGIWAGFSVVMLLCAALCGVLDTLIPKVRLPMLVLGAAYMLYLAIHIWQSGPAEARAGRSGVLPGLLLQFVNPKIYIYGIVSMEAYILPNISSPAVVALFALGLAFTGFVLTLCWSAFGSLLGRLFSRHARVVNKILALLLVWCAISLFL